MAQPDALIGAKIDNYTIVRHLARGGMADVYLARNVRLQRDVALKILLPSFIENVAFVERFRREAQAMARLQHPNLVQVYDTGDTPDGRPYIAMQYVRGGTLEDLLLRLEQDGQVMTAPFALAIVRQVASALQVAHTEGIVHRDLKPSNILLDEQRRPLLTDLGIAYVADTQRLTRTDTFIGTPHYMSPEQGKGLPLDARSDIYSLGVVLFEMLAGQRPFPGDSHWVLIHQHTSVPAPALSQARPGLSRAVNQLVARCLEKEPGRRYQSAAELAVAVDRALAEEGAAGMLTASGEWQWRPKNTGELFVGRAGRLRQVTPKMGRTAPTRLLAGLGTIGVIAVVIIWLLIRDPGPPVTQVPTSLSVTQLVEVTREVTGTPPASSTPAPTAGNSPTQGSTSTVEAAATHEPPATRTLEPSPTEQGIAGRIVSDVRTRQGPGMSFPEARPLSRDEVVSVLGDDGRGNWYLVRSATGEPVWVSARFITAVTGSLDDVTPAATIPPPPTGTQPPPAAAATNTPASPTGDGGGGGPATSQPPPSPSNTPFRPGPTNTPFRPSP